MRTVKNVGPGRELVKLTQADLEKIAAACGYTEPFDYLKRVFYEPFAPQKAEFTEYVEDKGSPFIKSMRFRQTKR